MNLIAYIDGGSRGNPGPSAAAFVITDKAGNIIYEDSRFLGTATNNEAEYYALIELLKWLGEYRYLHKASRDAVYVRCDSQLLVCQVTGQWKVKEPRLKELLAKVHELKKRQPFRLYIRHIYREGNTQVDRLVKEEIRRSCNTLLRVGK